MKVNQSNRLTSYRANRLTSHQSGFATLPTIMALMILVLVASAGMATWSLSEVFSTQGQNQSQSALVYAKAGAQDALTRIARNASYTSASYTIDFIEGAEDGCSTNNGCATISVVAGSPKVITSTGRVKNNYRKIQVDVTISTDGEITSTVWQEL